MLGVKSNNSQDRNSAYFCSLYVLGDMDTQGQKRVLTAILLKVQGTVRTLERSTKSRLRRSGKASKRR